MSEVFNEPKKQIDGVYIPYGCHAQAACRAPGVMAHAHVHAYIEILYGLEGRYTLQTNENSITFSAGDMVLIHAHEVHRYLRWRKAQTGISSSNSSRNWCRRRIARFLS